MLRCKKSMTHYKGIRHITAPIVRCVRQQTMPKPPLERVREFSLSALASTLKARSKQLKLVGLIERAVSVCSAHEDLRSSAECLRDLKVLTSSKTAPKNLAYDTLSTISGALTAHSIVLYCRATQTSSGNRRAWFGLEMLDQEQLELHDRVKRLRDNAIAHFGFGSEHPEGPLIREALILSLTPPGPRPIFHSSWAMNKAAFTSSFESLVSRVQDVARARASDRMNEVMVEITRIGAADKSLLKALRKHPFDADEFFLSGSSRTEMYEALKGAGVATLHVPTTPDAD